MGRNLGGAFATVGRGVRRLNFCVAHVRNFPQVSEEFQAI